jgi:hypothetical protein
MEKCATEECENTTEFHICENCVDKMMGSYERHIERNYYREN